MVRTQGPKRKKKGMSSTEKITMVIYLTIIAHEVTGNAGSQSIRNTYPQPHMQAK